MFVFNWLKGAFNSASLFKKRRATILLLGLDNSGKTTLKYRLKDDKMLELYGAWSPYYPEEITIGNIDFRVFDLGGNEYLRKRWKEYHSNVQGVVYLIDAADPSRFAESKEELERLFKSPELEGVPFVVLGNKIDKRNAVLEDELRQAFDFASEDNEKLSDLYGSPVGVFMCSVVKRVGYQEALKWFCTFI